jgi:carbon-monoxide dehydrogenase large subunit
MSETPDDGDRPRGDSDDADGIGVGDGVPRREDAPLLTGEATYTDDVDERDLLHAAVLRSPHAHATIRDVDTSAAEAMSDVVAVYTATDVDAAGTPGDIQPLFTGGLPRLELPRRPLLAEGAVRYEGEGVAVVVATDRYAAHDALDRIDVAYGPREAVVDPVAAVDEEDAPVVHEPVPDNVALEWELGDAEATDAAFEDADQVTTLELRNQRLAPNAIEPRAAVATYETAGERLTVRMTTQVPHVHRRLFADALGLPEHRVRIVAPEVGGGFGSKIHHYPAETLAAWCAVRLGRPVKWQARRSESFRTDSHGRGHRARAELAVDDDGCITGLRSETVASIGAYVSTISPVVPTFNYGLTHPGQYEIPAVHCRVRGAFTHTTPTDAYRGAGRPESAFLIERLVDRAARERGEDPVEFRRRNFIPADAFPYAAPYGVAGTGPLMYDSGDYERALEAALDRLDYEAVRERRADLREEDRYLGVGFSCYTEACGLGPSMLGAGLEARGGMNDTALIRFHPSGTVTAYVGTSAHGQGHETAFAQVLADELGVPYDDIEVVEGDTDRVPYGLGTFNSRSAVMGGGSLVEAADAVIEKARGIAAGRFGVSPEEVTFESGRFEPAVDDDGNGEGDGDGDEGDGDGSMDASVHIQDLAREAHLGRNLPADRGAGLEASAAFDPMGFTFPFGTHAAVVEVDAETGRVDIERYVAVDDCGPRLNPRIVEGQVHGGVAQGIGQALYEEATYADDGTLESGALDEYAVPRATEIPDTETDETVTPSPLNPLGVKGVGEGGTIAAPPAVVNAVLDALEPFDVDHLDMPLTPETVWEAMGRPGPGGRDGDYGEERGYDDRPGAGRGGDHAGGGV